MASRRYGLQPQLLHDMVWSVQSQVQLFGAASKLAPWLLGNRPLGLACALGGPVSSLLLILFALRHQRCYLAWRTPILSGLKLLRAIITTAVCLLTPAEDVLMPMSSGLLLCPAIRGAILCVMALGYPLPLAVHLWVHALIFAISLTATKQRCSRDCELPDGWESYAQLARRINSALSQGLPVTIARRRGSHPGGPRPCLLLHTWVQFSLGYLLPLVVLSWCEAKPPVLRVQPASPSARPHTLLATPQRVLVLLHHLGLLLAAVVVSWRGLEVLLGAWQAVKGLGPTAALLPT